MISMDLPNWSGVPAKQQHHDVFQSGELACKIESDTCENWGHQSQASHSPWVVLQQAMTACGAYVASGAINASTRDA